MNKSRRSFSRLLAFSICCCVCVGVFTAPAYADSLSDKVDKIYDLPVPSVAPVTATLPPLPFTDDHPTGVGPVLSSPSVLSDVSSVSPLADSSYPFTFADGFFNLDGLLRLSVGDNTDTFGFTNTLNLQKQFASNMVSLAPYDLYTYDAPASGSASGEISANLANNTGFFNTSVLAVLSNPVAITSGGSTSSVVSGSFAFDGSSTFTLSSFSSGSAVFRKTLTPSSCTVDLVTFARIDGVSHSHSFRVFSGPLVNNTVEFSVDLTSALDAGMPLGVSVYGLNFTYLYDAQSVSLGVADSVRISTSSTLSINSGSFSLSGSYGGDSSAGILDSIKEFFAKVGDFLANLPNFLINLFIPTGEQFNEFLTHIQEKMEFRNPVLSSIIDFVTSFFNTIVHDVPNASVEYISYDGFYIDTSFIPGVKPNSDGVYEKVKVFPSLNMADAFETAKPILDIIQPVFTVFFGLAYFMGVIRLGLFFIDLGLQIVNGERGGSVIANNPPFTAAYTWLLDTVVSPSLSPDSALGSLSELPSPPSSDS